MMSDSPFVLDYSHTDFTIIISDGQSDATLENDHFRKVIYTIKASHFRMTEASIMTKIASRLVSKVVQG